MGAIIHYAPGVLKGAMEEYLGKVNFNEFIGFVTTDKKLWNEIPDNIRASIEDLGPRLGNIDWLTPEWIMDAGKKSAPSIYSLLIGWPEGQVWLQKQVDDIKRQIFKESANEQLDAPGSEPEPTTDTTDSVRQMPSLPEPAEDGGTMHTKTKRRRKAA